MNSTEQPIPPSRRPSLLKNWLSMTGLVVVIGSLFSTMLLFLIDTIGRSSNPYIGILTYFVAPFFLITGLVLTAIGALRERKKLGESAGLIPKIVVDLTRPRDRKIMAVFLSCSVLFLLISAVGSYHTYHFTESVTFCGQACHTVMEPELVTYQHGSHARVACVQCHIGPGATWFVKSKLSGTYQVYATVFDKYPTPIPTPIPNLRPAQETCEQCHWPKKFVGNLDRTYHYFLSDPTNTPYTLRMTMKVGGGDPTSGPVSGIHWHMSVANKIQYYPADEDRQKIPYVRVTDMEQGVVTVYRTKSFTNEVSESELRTMDCIDCHNRPAHRYKAPNAAIDLEMLLGHIDPSLTFAKSNAVFALTQTYTNKTQALEGIATYLAEWYAPDKFPKAQPAVHAAIASVQQVYKDNFFPQMNANWQKYPENIGHKVWPGCFRCHDGEHATPEGRAIKSSDCNSCHTILAQGTGEQLQELTPAGQKFNHPGGDEVEGSCNDCHTGAL